MPQSDSSSLIPPEVRKALARLGVFEHDYSTGTSFPNDLWLSWGYTAEDLDKNIWLDVIHPEDRPRVKAAVDKLFSGETDVFEETYRVKTRYGEYRWIANSGTLLTRDEQGRPGKYIGADRDITMLKETEKKLSAALAHTQLHALEKETLQAAGAAVTSSLDSRKTVEIILDQAQFVIPYDTASVQILEPEGLRVVGGKGWGKDDVVGIVVPYPANNPNSKAIEDRQPLIIDDLSGFDPIAAPLMNPRISSWIGVPLLIKDEVVGLLSCNRFKPHYFDRHHVRLAAGFADFMAIALNNARLHEEMRQLAITDSLTGLNTRRWFYSHGEKVVEQSLRYHWPLSALMVDVDDFKEINDTYGHQVGDDVLVALADGCRRTLRKSDLVCRYGGEEIAVLMPETDSETALATAERLRQEVKQIPVEGLGGLVSISIGAATRESDRVTTIEGLLKQADDALLAAKRQGKDQVQGANP